MEPILWISHVLIAVESTDGSPLLIGRF